MERQEGYYWVKEQSSSVHVGRFIIARWNGISFEISGSKITFDVFDFEFINENRIKSPGELPD